MNPSDALKALERELQLTLPRVQGVLTIEDFMVALQGAIADAENQEWYDRMGDDL